MSDLIQLLPQDEHNQKLKANVHPPDWQNPTPANRYNLVVIGAGAAGLVTAAGAAGLGARVALVERELMGGDCLNVGCVPSKSIISSARVASTVRHAHDFGIRVSDGIQVDFASVMQRMRRLRAGISLHDSAERFRQLGVDVYFGEAEFVDRTSVRVDGNRLNFKKAVIASGSRALVPPIDGLDSVDYLTNESVFSLTELPACFGIIGAGPVGAELAQSFAQLGSQVHLFASDRGVLPREDHDASDIVERQMVVDGVRIYRTARRLAVSKESTGIRLTVVGDSTPDTVVDKLLVAVGREPNVEGLNLNAAGVHHDKQGVAVNNHLQTTNRRIYAAGDVCSNYKFTHSADFMARMVIQKALFFGRTKASALTIPWCTYTTPEVAQVGLTENTARQQGIVIDTYTQKMKDVDRAILEGKTVGYVKVHVKQGTDRIVGATIVAHHAGDLISEITLAMQHKIGLGKIANTIHPYPTQAEAIRKLGDAYNRTRLTPFVNNLFNRWMSWTR